MTMQRSVAKRAIPTLLMATVLAALTAPAALADTCCGTADVRFEPPSAAPGVTVTVEDIRCVEADGATSLDLATLDRFWLTTMPRDAFLESEASIDYESWPTFAEVRDPTEAEGTATIVVPGLPPGSYQLWWGCAGSDGSVVRHYATGSPLRVGPPTPDTSTAATVDDRSGGRPDLVVLALALTGTLLALLRRGYPALRQRT
jgi:hypothetical protein